MFTSMSSWRATSGVREVELHRSGSSASEESSPSQPSSPTSSLRSEEPCTPTSTASTTPSVRAKAAFFEALIKSNTPTLVRCEEGGLEQELADLRGRCAPELSGDETDASFSEVTMTLRLPRRRATRERGPSAAEAEASSELRARLARVEAALSRKMAECDNLSRVLKELAEGRVRATCARAVLAERHAELQAEFHRLQRVAELSREVSRENIAKTSKTAKALRQVSFCRAIWVAVPCGWSANGWKIVCPAL